jgi:hypothetical protein
MKSFARFAIEILSWIGRRGPSVILAVLMSTQVPVQARTLTTGLVKSCSSWLTTNAGTYRTSAMALRYYLMDITVSYVASDRLPELAIEYDAEEEAWVYARSKEQVKPGSYMFVMDRHGQLFILSPYESNRHHSSFLRGRPVASAGHLNFDRHAQLSDMSTATGHYHHGFRDSCENWRQFVSELRARNAPTGQIRINEVRGSLFRPVYSESFYVSAAADLAASCDDRTGLLTRPIPAATADDRLPWRVTTTYISNTGKVIRPFESYGDLKKFVRRLDPDLLAKLEAQKSLIQSLMDAQFREDRIHINDVGPVKVVGLYPLADGVEIKLEGADQRETSLILLSLGQPSTAIHVEPIEF